MSSLQERHQVAGCGLQGAREGTGGPMDCSLPLSSYSSCRVQNVQLLSQFVSKDTGHIVRRSVSGEQPQRRDSLLSWWPLTPRRLVSQGTAASSFVHPARPCLRADAVHVPQPALRE